VVNSHRLSTFVEESTLSIQCRVCSSELKFYVRKNDHDVMKCVVCGFGQVNVTAAEISDFYDKAYFSGEKAHFEQVENADAPRYHRYWIEKNLDRISKDHKLRVLEIGPGLGAPIAGYLRRDHPEIEFAAIEISDYASERLEARGFEIHRGRVTDTKTLHKCRAKYDLIFGTEVIEHDPEPHGFIQAVHDMLKPGGWAAFTTGNIDGGMSRWKKEEWYYLDPPAHVSYFNPRSVKQLFGSEGFEKVSVGCYGFNYIELKLKTHLPGILLLAHLSKISTGMSIAAQRAISSE